MRGDSPLAVSQGITEMVCSGAGLVAISGSTATLLFSWVTIDPKSGAVEERYAVLQRARCHARAD